MRLLGEVGRGCEIVGREVVGRGWQSLGEGLTSRMWEADL